ALAEPVIKDFLQELSQSYRLLLHVFRYLTAKDLMVTSRVCLMWRDISYSQSLWSSLRLRNICVSDWNQLALFMERRNTATVDLRKMVFRLQEVGNADSEETSRPPSSDPPSPSSSLSEDVAVLSSAESTHIKEPSAEKGKENFEGQKGHVTDDGNLQSSKNVDIYLKESSSSIDTDGHTLASPEPFTSDREIQISVDQRHKNEKEVSVKDDVITSEEHTDGEKNADTMNASDIKMEKALENKPSLKDGTELMEVEEEVSVKGISGDNKSQSSDRGHESSTPSELRILQEKEKKDIHEQEVKHETNVSKGRIVTSLRKAAVSEKFGDSQSRIIDTWKHICEALGTVRCLRSVVLPWCKPAVLHLLLSSCKNLTSVTAAEIGVPYDTKFDPAYLMMAPSLREIRIGSTQGFSFTTNFNFIKLPELKVLVIRGFQGKTWPYLGTNLTSLHLGPCKNFTAQSWHNIGSMSKLKALWLEDGGSLGDNYIYEALSRLTQLRRLCLFNFTVGSKLGIALRKLNRLERLFVLQDSDDGVSMGIKNHNMLAVTEHLKCVLNLVWAVSSSDTIVIKGVDHMLIFSPNVKSYPSLSAQENTTDLWPLKLIETVVSRHLPLTEVRIMKLDPAA
ncbi:hypothetical protein SK128_001057, partial [Halocaridina rubra]